MLRTAAYAWSALAVAAVGLGAIYWQGRPVADPFADCRASAISGGSGAIGGDFTLVDEDGKTATSADIFRKPSLVYFGYTYCPDICPVDSARNAEAVDLLEEQGLGVTPIFVSVDPGRDTPEVLKAWTDYLHPRMIGFTGSAEQIKAAANAFKTVFRVPEDTSSGDYLVDHMTYSYLMLPGSGFAEFFPRDASAKQVADTTSCFMTRDSANQT